MLCALLKTLSQRETTNYEFYPGYRNVSTFACQGYEISSASGETLRNFCNDTRHLLLNQTGFSRGYLATVQGGNKMTVQSYVLDLNLYLLYYFKVQMMPI